MVCLCWFAHIVGRNIYLKGRVKQRTKKKKGERGKREMTTSNSFGVFVQLKTKEVVICTGNLIKLYVEKINRNDALL